MDFHDSDYDNNNVLNNNNGVVIVDQNEPMAGGGTQYLHISDGRQDSHADQSEFDENLENSEKKSNSGNNTLKRRSFYSTLGPEQMGVPGSPIYENSPENQSHVVPNSQGDEDAMKSDGSVPACDYLYCSDSDTSSCRGHTIEQRENDRFFYNPDFMYENMSHDFSDNRCETSIAPAKYDFVKRPLDQTRGALPPTSPHVTAGGCSSDGDATPSTTLLTRATFLSADRPSAVCKGPRVPSTIGAELDEGMVRSPDSHDSGIHVEYSSNRKKHSAVNFDSGKFNENEEKLPVGWEKCEDPKGRSYYWHVDSGTVQREIPQPLLDGRELRRLSHCKESPRRSAHNSDADLTYDDVTGKNWPIKKDDIIASGKNWPIKKRPSVIIDRSNANSATSDEIACCTLNSKFETAASIVSPKRNDDLAKLPIRFAVRSLGWTEVDEENLKQDRSSRTINKAIIDLSTGRKDFIDNVSKWGDGKELILELDDQDLRLLDPDTGTLLNTQPIYQIRVWGVGRDTGRDFAYVSRDRATRRYMCHVFRCDAPARTIANTLRDICKRLTLERCRATSSSNGADGPNDGAGGAASRAPLRHSPRRRQTLGGATGASEPATNGFGAERRVKSTSTDFTVTAPLGAPDGPDVPRSRSGGPSFSNGLDTFPTPIEEPKKIVRCHFLGITQVSKPTGIDILNDAIDRLVQQVKVHRWILCDVSISPCTITITEVGNEHLAECRVRYLSFLGIGRDIKHCAFIMQSSMDNYMCYVFYVEPSAGAMAKTIEAACKLRYQKVIDAHGEQHFSIHKGWTDALRDVLGTFTSRKPSSRSFSLYPR